MKVDLIADNSKGTLYECWLTPQECKELGAQWPTIQHIFEEHFGGSLIPELRCLAGQRPSLRIVVNNIRAFQIRGWPTLQMNAGHRHLKKVQLLLDKIQAA